MSPQKSSKERKNVGIRILEFNPAAETSGSIHRISRDAPFASKVPRWVLWTWNSVSTALLLMVVIVAILSIPSPFQQLKPDNIWVAYFPFVWLPTAAVVAALLGHLVLFRKLNQARKSMVDQTVSV